jgi:formylglycine-generating enzyme required for sulfatase activity
VTLTRAFWMGKVPVTQGQWQVVMGSNPAEFKQAGLEAPVELVSWDDVQSFLTRLNGVQSQWTFRLPTEAEWEYACRAGSQGERYGEVDVIAWHSQNSGRTTHPVGQKQANAFGLYDMNGNVWQWCQDWYGDYPKGFVTDPEGAASDMYGQVRVVRGGSWEVDGLTVRSATRNYNLPETRSAGLGFRMVAVPRNR